jgi:hypothetical protein
MSDRIPVEIDHASGQVEDLPQQKGQRYRCKLDTLADVKREMAKVYRESRSETIDVQVATKQIWMLQALGKLIVDSEIEQRLEALEQKQ